MIHFIGQSCAGEICGMCYRQGKSTPATHKVGEEIPDDAPPELTRKHNLTQYVCCLHFAAIINPYSARNFRGCDL